MRICDAAPDPRKLYEVDVIGAGTLARLVVEQDDALRTAGLRRLNAGHPSVE
jgi:hypothetical protein